MPIKVFLSAVVSTKTLEAIDYADQHRMETAIYAGAAIYASWKRDIVNGDAFSRAEYVGNVAAQIVIPYGEFKLAVKASDITRVSRLKALGKLKAAKDKSVEFVQRVKRIRTAPKTIMITPEGLHVPANEFLSQEELWRRFSNGPDVRDVNHNTHKNNSNSVSKIKVIGKNEKLPGQGIVNGRVPDAPNVDAGKQGKHVLGHPNHIQSKSSWPEGTNGVELTQLAWQKGEIVKPDGSVKKFDFQKPIGPNGETKVKVHMDKKGYIHGYPVKR
ncbi:hypothetical protein WD019_11685 [Fictibacillus sp. Mic-4]|uniref:hypothetical protein n=1 Tax=Fictibacillus sp. Mic-4 TaxID=3132826 RepID=UPI003CF6742D